MSHPDPPQEIFESADAYGRRVGCFIDHLDRPLRFKDHMKFLEDACEATDSQGLVPQQGLRAASLPNPVVDLNRFEAGGFPEQTFVSNDIYLPSTARDSLETWSPASWVRQLQLPLELPILNSNPADDLRLYLSAVNERQSCNIVDQWLPLSSTCDIKNEGLSFPPSSARFHQLLCREIDKERIIATEDAFILEEKDIDLDASSIADVKLPSFRKLLVDPITPPLSPVSEDTSVFIPDASTCFIDLTSEPSSPVDPRVKNIQNGVLDDKIEPNSTLSAFGLDTPQSPPLPPVLNQTLCLQYLKLDVPAVEDLSSSDAVNANDVVLRQGVEAQANASEEEEERFESFFENAFAEALDAYQIKANEAVEQEQYDPNDSFSRMRVPRMDFTLPSLAWEAHVSCAKSHFAWLQMQSPNAFLLQHESVEAELEMGLQWVPIPQGKDHPQTMEELAPLNLISKTLLATDPCHDFGSSHYVKQPARLAILQIAQEEEELEPIQAPDDHTECSPFFLARKSPPLQRLPEAMPSRLGSPSLMDLIRSKAREKATDEPVAPCLGDGTIDTGRLLSGFMEMRAVKRPKLGQSMTSATATAADTHGHSLPSCASSVTVTEATAAEQEPAAVPKAPMPDEKAKFVVSIELARPILNYLESFWSPDHLIDRDYSVLCPEQPKELQHEGALPQSTIDADISLTPAVGVIVTNLSKARQRSLPGSESLPQLRERILKVSMKYATLIVLVSELNAAGEFVGTLSASDVAAYADFVLFTVGLEADVSPSFVSGSYETTARWILALMYRYSPSSLDMSRYISGSESTWELFFRRAGMNVVAAQVLSGVLFEEAGNEGLARFLAMTVQERLTRYSRILGSENLLLRASQVLDQPWH